jgi:hypothetical protein
MRDLDGPVKPQRETGTVVLFITVVILLGIAVAYFSGM